MKENLGRAVKDISLTVEFERNEMVVEPSYEEGWEIFPRYHPIVSRCRLYTITNVNFLLADKAGRSQAF